MMVKMKSYSHFMARMQAYNISELQCDWFKKYEQDFFKNIDVLQKIGKSRMDTVKYMKKVMNNKEAPAW